MCELLVFLCGGTPRDDQRATRGPPLDIMIPTYGLAGFCPNSIVPGTVTTPATSDGASAAAIVVAAETSQQQCSYTNVWRENAC